MIKIYHNPRCRKSREGLAILRDANLDVEIIKYLDTPPSEKEIKDILSKLGLKPIELVRTKEAIWKEKFKGKDLSDAAIIKAMHTYPKLIERPIVISDDKAALGRPPEAIKDII